MNRRKVAVFVEGMTEQTFVREFLLKWYEYDAARLGIECYALRSDNQNESPFPWGDRSSENFYMILNVGNDKSVFSKMLFIPEFCRRAT